jgi:hypothetical protein
MATLHSTFTQKNATLVTRKMAARTTQIYTMPGSLVWGRVEVNLCFLRGPVLGKAVLILVLTPQERNPDGQT